MSAAAPSAYAALLNRAQDEALSGAVAHVPIAQQPLLNGAPYQTFRQSVALGDRRRAGTFFSSAELAQELADLLRTVVHPGGRVLDPSCGIGDLLLAYAGKLPLGATLNDTLDQWGEQLAGIDQWSDLVGMTKARLVALARARGRFSGSLRGLDHLFPHIIVGNMFFQVGRLAEADGFLFNPPFGGTNNHEVSSWGTGKLSSAALFLDALTAVSQHGVPIAAVLPEVLRCGSRYAPFRTMLGYRGISGTFTSRGQFDAWTDVDVFTTLLQPEPGPLWQEALTQDKTVGDRFVIRVGSVVPHRHANKGPWHRFICAKSVPAWSEGFAPVANRRFKGRVFAPPFVVIRRTSSPKDRKRAVGAIITGDRPVAVENHLVVLVPKDGGYSECQNLLAVLKVDRTSEYLNRSIRCRHLTTGSVAAIPWNDA